MTKSTAAASADRTPSRNVHRSRKSRNRVPLGSDPKRTRIDPPNRHRPHTHALYVHAHSPIHALRPERKLAAIIVFVIAVALTRPGAYLAFGLDAIALLAVAARARLRPAFVLRRMLVALPFVAFAFLLPFFADGDRTDVLGFSVSQPGLESAGTILAKAGLGMTASILLAATTEVPALLRGLRRLRVPVPIVAIAGFAFRFMETIAGELARMRVAMAARGLEPRWFWQARPVAVSAGATFVRSYERGERVHAAMVARGFDGTMPDLDSMLAEASPVDGPNDGARLRLDGAWWMLALTSVAVTAAIATSALFG